MFIDLWQKHNLMEWGRKGGREGGVCVRWGLSGGGGCFCVLVTGWMALETENGLFFGHFFTVRSQLLNTWKEQLRE